MEEAKWKKFKAIFSHLTFILLCSLAIYMLSQVVLQFFSESSNFKQFEESITGFPTIMVCTPSHSSPGAISNYEIDFDIGA